MGSAKDSYNEEVANKDCLRGNEIEVYDGLEPGDLIVSAGVAFLRDGMNATAWTPRA